MNIKPPGIASRNHVYDRYKRRAKYKNLEWNLSLEDFCVITQKNCYYCGLPPSNEFTQNKARGGLRTPYTYSGIDRIDNSLGYIPNNIRAACAQCNRAKGILSQEEFYDWVRRIRECFEIG